MLDPVWLALHSPLRAFASRLTFHFARLSNDPPCFPLSSRAPPDCSLYTALSRVRSRRNARVRVQEGEETARNVTYRATVALRMIVGHLLTWVCNYEMYNTNACILYCRDRAFNGRSTIREADNA
jgi:hypothetical protein